MQYYYCTMLHISSLYISHHTTSLHVTPLLLHWASQHHTWYKTVLHLPIQYMSQNITIQHITIASLNDTAHYYYRTEHITSRNLTVLNFTSASLHNTILYFCRTAQCVTKPYMIQNYTTPAQTIHDTEHNHITHHHSKTGRYNTITQRNFTSLYYYRTEHITWPNFTILYFRKASLHGTLLL